MATATSRTKTNGTTKSTRARTSRSRAEVSAQFDDINDEVTGREAEDPKTAAAKKSRAEEVRKAVGALTPETVVSRISSVTLDVSKVLAGVQQQLVAAVEDYNTTNEAVSLLKLELEDLHKKDIAATALDQLVQDYEGKARDLELEIQTKRLAWEQEQITKERAQKETEETFAKLRKRGEDDYVYKTLNARKQADDDFTEALRLKQRENLDRQESLEKDWLRREENLKAREAELTELKAKVAALPIELDNAVKKAEAIREGVLKKHYETQLQLLTKDKETDARVATAEIKNLQETSQKQALTVTQLQEQLDAARKQVESIAGKALDSASGRAALEQVQSVIRDQPKTGK